MKKVRTLGRRMWETRLPIRFAGFVAICMLSVSVWFLWSSVRLLQRPHSPHYGTTHCFDCHEGNNNHPEHADCYTCHDILTRGLLPGAMAAMLKQSPKGTCLHDIKGKTVDGRRSVTSLCLSCHKSVNGYVAMVNIESKQYVEIDMAMTHPIGLKPTETIHPKTLPLSKETGAINCITCHDQHAADKRLRMLRYYYPGNGHPADFRPLCNDCHPDGWLPLKVRPDTVKETSRRD